MKVMHIIDSGGFYGAEAMLIDLMVSQKKNGLHPILCSIGTVGQFDKEVERQASNCGLEVCVVRFRSGLNVAGAYRISRIAQVNHVDMLHSHGYKSNILTGIIPRFIRKLPVVSTLHGWTNTRSISKMTLYEWMDRRMLRYKDAVVTVNRLMLDDPRLISANIPQRKLYVVNNGINLDPPVADEKVLLARELIKNYTRDCFTIGAVGRLSAEKGFDILLQAISLLHKEGLEIKLVLIGDGPMKNELQHMAVSLGIDKYVLFTGYLTNASLYFNCFDILTISSLTEGLPITLLEAMRAGVPVVSTQVGGIPDVITDGKSGMLVTPGNVAELSAAIKLISVSPKIRDSLRNMASANFREYYTSNKMAINYQTIYEKL